MHQCRQVARRLPVGVQRPLFLTRPTLSDLVVADGHQFVPGDAVAFLPHQLLPLALVADTGRMIEQADRLHGLGQRGILGPKRAIFRQQQLLAMQEGD